MNDQTHPVPPAPDQNPPASTSTPAPPPPPPPTAEPTAARPPAAPGWSQPQQPQHHGYAPHQGYQQPQGQPAPPAYGQHYYGPHSGQTPGLYPHEPKKKGWVVPTLIAGVVLLIGAITAIVFLFVLPGSDESGDEQGQNETSSSPAPSEDGEKAPDDADPGLDDTLPGSEDSPAPEIAEPDDPSSDIDPPNLPDGFPKPSDFNRKPAGDRYEFDPGDPKLEGGDDLGELFDEFRDQYTAMNEDESLWQIIEPTPENTGAYIAFQFILTDMRSALRFGVSPEDETYYAHQAKYLESLLLAEQPLGTSISYELQDGKLFEYDGDTGVTTIE